MKKNWTERINWASGVGFLNVLKFLFAQFPSFLNEEPTATKTFFRYCWCLTKSVKKQQISPMGRFGAVLVNTAATWSRGRGFNYE